MYAAYERVFTRCGLSFRAVEAQAGEIGGDVNHEFMAPTAIGEDLFVYAPDGTYAANLEAAYCRRPEPVEPGTEPLTRVHTPGVPGVDDLAVHLGIPTSRILKCVLYKLPGKLPAAGAEGRSDSDRRGEGRTDGRGDVVAVLVPGDRDVNEYKLATVLGAPPALLDTADFAANPQLVRGYVGPAGLAPHVSRIVADHHVAAGRDWCTGANDVDYHVTGCNLGRDFTPDEFADVTNVQSGDPSPDGSGPLAIERSVEVGHIFQLGTKYSQALDARYLDANGKDAPMVMGCYGIGVSRILSVVIEQHHDDNGVRWPANLAPYDVEVVPLGKNVDVEAVTAVAAALDAEGLDVLIDDRSGSAGVKFADADLIGCSVQVIAGRRLAEGVVEVRTRDRATTLDVDVADLPKIVQRLLGDTGQ
jgi:prolyl-tRNA synthetase